MKNVLVTGSDGQLGMELRDLAKDLKGYNFIFTNREKLDISDESLIQNFFNLYKIDFCINCAAYTKVDKAEEEHELAFQINTDAAAHLAAACAKHNSTMIHISTDFVFDGKNSKPYKETDPTNALSVYGQSKLSGEEKVTAINERSIVIRTSWVYSTYGNNFVKTMMRLGAVKPELKVVCDQIGTPTYANDLAHLILKMVTDNDLPEKYGLYHFSNEGVASWYDFAHAIMEIRDLDCTVLPIETKDYPTPAIRPEFSVLNKTKVKQTFKVDIPHWRDSLQICLNK